ncbi:MAG TPA: hypothetical protein VGG33_20320 [Polyangia bacterium]
MSMSASRETEDELRLGDKKASMVLTRIAPAIVLVSATGHDKGQFGDAPFVWLEREMGRHGAIEIFVDMREMFNATLTVADGWSAWIKRHRTRIRRMSLLVSSKYVQMTVEVAKLFSRTGDLMRVYTDAPAFSDAVSQSLGRSFVLGSPRT